LSDSRFSTAVSCGRGARATADALENFDSQQSGVRENRRTHFQMGIPTDLEATTPIWRSALQNAIPRILHRDSTVILALLIALLPTTAYSAPPTIDLGTESGSIEVIRCHFAESRIVVRFDDRLHVLHEGDRLGAANLKVVEINSDSAVFTIRGSGPTGHLRIFRVTNPSSSVIQLREFSTDPAALTSGKGTTGAPTANQKTRPPDPPSDV